MSGTISTVGSCLCGSVLIKAEVKHHNVGACHCSMCQKWSGGPFLAVESVGMPDISGEEHVTRFDSSEWAERGFCRKCGSNLFYHLKPKDMYILSSSIFAPETDLAMDHQIFIDEKPAYYDFANDTKNMTGAEVFAEFGEA